MPEPTDKQVRDSWARCLTVKGVAEEFGWGQGKAAKRIDALGIERDHSTRRGGDRRQARDWLPSEKTGDAIADKLLKLLQGKRKDEEVSLIDVANILDCPPHIVQEAAELARGKGFSVHFSPVSVQLVRTPDLRPASVLHDFYGDHFKIGLLSCTHHGSIYAADNERLQFYEVCRREGVEHLYHCGDITAGNNVYRGQLRDLRDGYITADSQARLAAEDVVAAGLPMSFILGDHDDKWLKDFGFNVGDHIEVLAKELGAKHAVECLGHGSARVLVGKKPYQCVLDLVHPGGGTAYALSYRCQKIVESYTGGDKPHIVAVGHFHKAEEIPHLRNTMAIQPGCFEWQTPFMRSRALEAHVAGCIVEGWMGKVGKRYGLTRTRVEFVKFYAPERESAG